MKMMCNFLVWEFAI